ncbi:unnamed protein product [Sphenostylis stenocarpa]|uniref:C3H1-type domain-containing protein n=1 Tax=Sphenostylis stenocarpa TaxID=92480 RepID=A0AA86SYV3_9FABA|nr:unnamed protein product [Sphenostylis stenocarpa]
MIQIERGIRHWKHFGVILLLSSVPPVLPPPPQPPPPPPQYQQAPPHFHQFPPPNVGGPPPPPPNIGGPPPPPPPHHVYLNGPPPPPPPNSSSSVPLNLPVQGSLNVMPNTGQSYAIPSQLHHGSSMAPQASWAPGPQTRVLPPPPPPPPPSASQGQILYNPPFHRPPLQPGDVQNLHNAPPPPPPSSIYFHSTVGNYQVPPGIPPPLPSSPPPALPAPPPPPLTAPVTSFSSNAAGTGPHTAKFSGLESKTVNSVDESGIVPVNGSDSKLDGPSCRDVASAEKDDNLPPPKPTEETIQKIEALCQLIAENGADIEDKIRRDEFQNPEYEFLFGGEPGTEAAISNTYFLWMKKKYNLDNGWHENKRQSEMVYSSSKRYIQHVATVNADSDMEMEALIVCIEFVGYSGVQVTPCTLKSKEDCLLDIVLLAVVLRRLCVCWAGSGADDITLSDKDQGSNYATEGLTQQHNPDDEDEVFSVNQNIRQLQKLSDNDPAKDISSCSASYFGSMGVSKRNEGPEILSDSEHSKSVRSVTRVCCSPENNSTEVAELPLGTALEKTADCVDDDFTQTGTSDHNETTTTERDYGPFLTSGSPIRLLQDYASDDTSANEDEGNAADTNVFTFSGGADTGVSAVHKGSGSHMEIGIGSNSPSSTQKGFRSVSRTLQNDSEISPHLLQESKKTRKKSVSRWSSDGGIEHNLENQVSVNFSASVEAIKGKDRLDDTGIDSGSKSGYAEKEDEGKTSKFEPNVIKVDEFGRHLREVRSDSDSDDSHHHRARRHNKRDRSCSRSRSPPDRRSRRNRRSPRRRRDKRNRSRSWSPRHRRSSRSPISRRSGDFRGEIVKRDKDQCLDFLRGKCYRGASCKYIHLESDMNATSRRHRNKHDLEVSSCGKGSTANGDMTNISSKVFDSKRDGVKSQDVDLCQNVTSQEVVRKEDSGRNDVASMIMHLDGKLVNSNSIKSKCIREVAPEILETIVVREDPKNSIHENDGSKAGDSQQQHLVEGFHLDALGSDSNSKLSGTYKDVFPSGDGPFVQQMHLNVSAVGIPEPSGYPSQHVSASFVTDTSPDKRSVVSASVNEVPGSVTSEQPSLHSQAPKELPPPLHNYQLPASVVSQSPGENPVHMSQTSRQYDVMQQNAFFPFQSTTREKFEPYPAPLHTQNSHFNVTPNSSWTSLPLPPPPLPLPLPPSRTVYDSSLNSGVVKSHVSSEFNKSQLHSRIDIVSQTSMKPLPTSSQSSEFQDHSRTFMLTEPFSPKHLPLVNPASLSGSSLNRDDFHNQLPMQDSKFPSTTSFGSLQPQPNQFSWKMDVSRLQSPLGGKLPPEGHFATSSHLDSLSQKQQSMYNFQCSVFEASLGVPGETATVSRYPPDFLDSNHSTSLPPFGGSRISAHYNPYASTFEKPLSSKFSSSIFRQENEIIHGNNYVSSRFNHTPVNGEGNAGVGSRQSASSSKSGRALGQVLPRSGDDQYDPLFDSIEPSSTLRKTDFDQKQELTGESNISLRPKSSYMSLGADEKNKESEEVGAVASTTSQNNDEYGETADAEVGAIENESLSDDVDVAKMTAEEVEINQVKSPGKRKKSKDSRSMKLFKVSIANFVKEVLKPSWRQGNMSKVAFKTIVKKTVDKVSGAMKGHRVPKSQVKISQYIDSSQRKLTKLVMGYVDKYVKV